jgi:hypothetical protein
MKRKAYIVAIAVCALAACWIGAASLRLFTAHSEFQNIRKTQPDSLGYPTSEQEPFFASASLRFQHSVGPLIKNPLRDDIRLYFDRDPKINRYSPDAWASNESGQWELKIHF